MPAPAPVRRLFAAALLGGACGGGQGGAQGGAPGGAAVKTELPLRTEAMLAGPLCKGAACQCREDDDAAGSPSAGHKRFELRLGPSDDPLWVTVDGMVLYKSGERPDACFYVDLRPGEHPVTLVGKGKDGLSAALSVAEQGGAEDATWWYRTFDFQCGTPGECDLETIEAWKREVSALGGKQDPCGSTKVKGIGWETGRMPDRTHPDEIELRLTLEVYKFVPANPPGSDECDAKSRATLPAGS
ncbi:MAG TPA: hypothetical protein VEL05_09745 [Candidatus Acidoferrum sp.]|nr:hypothetical protein [Candidatus Acidoferrum sp.]